MTSTARCARCTHTRPAVRARPRHASRERPFLHRHRRGRLPEPAGGLAGFDISMFEGRTISDRRARRVAHGDHLPAQGAPGAQQREPARLDARRLGRSLPPQGRRRAGRRRAGPRHRTRRGLRRPAPRRGPHHRQRLPVRRGDPPAAEGRHLLRREVDGPGRPRPQEIPAAAAALGPVAPRWQRLRAAGPGRSRAA